MNVPLQDSQARALANAAAAAPSLYNSQPWHFRYTRATGDFNVYADLNRALPEADPDGRGLHIGCGAAVMNLRVAAAYASLAAATELLPDPEDHRLLANVSIDETAGVEHQLSPLRAAIPLRHTSRSPFTAKRIPRDVRAELVEAAADEGVTLAFPEEWHLRWVLELAEEAAARSRTDQGQGEELRHWTRAQSASADTAGERVPEHAFGPRTQGDQAPIRDFTAGRRTAGMSTAPSEEYPQIALLATRDDRPKDWLRVGQAMQRVLLLATLNGLVNSFVTEVLEWTETRWPLRDPLAAVGAVHMVLRLGYGPRGPITPRRPLSDVLDIEDVEP